MTPVRYRWDIYCNRIAPGPWYAATPGKLARAFRALKMPRERLRVEYDNGQSVVFKTRRRGADRGATTGVTPGLAPILPNKLTNNARQ